ncbi:MAG: ABC transporter permease subunit [Ardenticatenales bacterium]|nr:ABC transporter permease subunit [Ardenticatenales bacterium]
MEETQKGTQSPPVFESEEEPYRGKQISTWARLRRCPNAMIDLALIGLLLIVALAADLVAPQGIDEQDLRKGLLPPSEEFILGTDEFGRDMLSRIIHGSRVSLQVGITATVISAIVGVGLGAIAGYFGGRIDYLIQGMVDISWAFPTVLLAIFLIGVLREVFDPGLGIVMVAVGLSYWGGFTRVVRGQVLSLREWEFVTAAHAIGASDWRVMFRHILPNVVAPVIIMSTLMMADSILIEATLSFLGLGAQPPIPSWGSILAAGRTYMRLAPWVTIFPGIAIMLTVLGFNLLGDGLRDALDPRLKNP